MYIDIDYSGTFHNQTLASYRSPRHGDNGYDYNYDYDMYLKDYGAKKEYNSINVHVPKDANLDALNRTITRLNCPPTPSWLSHGQMLVTIDCSTLLSANKTIQRSLSKIHMVLVINFDSQPINTLLELGNILWIAPDQSTTATIFAATNSKKILIQTVHSFDEGKFSTNV
ncbi:hypothetical protein DSO57_1039448 [Entomophthora muscae]|uniref:Uncharacterized protein n=1 Tax=Entomophthora muscae TaxID=34485 RepID=A0ACC2SBE6_9FUNG|nr:hypothetical protein DSO57_1039448 [Entomophthora muscae]